MTHVRTLLTHGSKIFWALMAAALVFTLTGNAAEANHQPANKVAASGATNEYTPVEGTPQLLLQERLRTSKPADLLLNVSAECSIITDVTNVGSETEHARGQLKFYVDIVTDGVTRRVGVKQTSTNPNESTDDDDGKAVFCDRLHRQRTAWADDEEHEIQQYLETRTANAFNWLALNVGSGVHTVKLYAEYDGENSAGSSASGIVGRRTMIVEPVRAANDENIHELDTSS